MGNVHTILQRPFLEDIRRDGPGRGDGGSDKIPYGQEERRVMADNPDHSFNRNTVETILKERGKEYGSLRENFSTIADLWGRYLASRTGGKVPIDVIDVLDVANMMQLLKIARCASGQLNKLDNYLDSAGYAMLGMALIQEEHKFDGGKD